MLARLMGLEPEPAPEGVPGVEAAPGSAAEPALPGDASPAARATLARLLGVQPEPAAPAPPAPEPVEPSGEETAPPAAPVSQQARSVLDRILPPGKTP